MTRLAAVDLGAQSGRVALGRFDGERLERRRRCTVSRTSPSACASTLQLGRARACTGTSSTASGPPRARRTIDAVAVDSWGVDFGLVDPTAGSWRTPSTTATPAAPPPSSACSRASRRASCTSARASS